MKSASLLVRALRIRISRYFEMMIHFCFFKPTTVGISTKLRRRIFLVSSGALLVSTETMIKSLVRQVQTPAVVTSFCSY